LAFLFIVLSQKNIHAQVQPFDSNAVKIDTSKFVMQKSPWGAVLRSAVLPGFGQFYNESYWKIPVFWGVLGALGYQWSVNNNNYLLNKDKYTASFLTKPGGNITYYRMSEFYRDQRDLVAVFIGLTYFLNLVDAYIDAHLFDFDVSQNNSVENFRLSLKVKF